MNGKCISTLGREDHFTAIRQTYYNYFTLHKQTYNKRRRMEENEEDMLS